MKTGSDTPETDSAVIRYGWGGVTAHAQRLERERDQLRQAIRAFMTDFERIQWGFDGDCGSAELADRMFSSIIEKP